MRKFKYEFETVRYPLIIMLIAFFLKGLSTTVLSELVRPYIGINFQWLITLMQIFQYFSTFVIQYIPAFIMIKILSKKNSSARVTLLFLTSYILLLTTTMVIYKRGMPAVAFTDLFGLKIETATILLKPYRVGIVGAVLSGYIVNKSYRMTRTRTKYAFLKFIDRDVLSLILTIIFTIITGLILTIVWPIVIKTLFDILNWIGSDISNPVTTIVYGFLDRVLSLFDLSAISRETLWFSNVGGSWMNTMGETFVGDVSIWQAQYAEGIFQTGFGRYITPYYILNLFAIPGMIIGMFSLYTNKKERNSTISFIIVLLTFIVLSDQLLTMEVFLVVVAPLLYVIHLIATSILFGILEGLKLFLGSNLITNINHFALGNGIELFNFYKNYELISTISSIIVIGVGVFILYFFLTRLYYRYFAVGLINKFEINNLVEEFLEIIGGIDNIEEIDSTPFRVEVKLKRPQMFDYELLEKTKINRIIETRSIYAIYYGAASTIIRKEVLIQKSILDEVKEES